MSSRLILALPLALETDIVLARKRTRELAEQIGFEAQDQTRITTAVSEIARNALDYAGGGTIEFRLAEPSAPELPQSFEIVVVDRGPGIANLAGVLDGSQRSAGGMGVGLLGARRLMDAFEVASAAGSGTTVRLGKRLPRRAPAVSPAMLGRIAKALGEAAPPDPLDEIRRQNRDMVLQLDALQARQDELALLNDELRDTNRGVVALYAELDERAGHLRQADELKSRFLSNMSHEFRTPLNSILALSRLLLTLSDGSLTPEQEKQVQFIRKAAESLTELVNDLLDLAKVEAGKTVVTPASFSAESLFGALRGMLRPLLVGDAVALVFEDPVGLPPLVSDEGKVSQILRNFISNAIKYTSAGEVRVSASHDGASDTVTFSVRDTGIGIAPEDTALIFQEFGQVANALQKRVKGTGLGLPLAKRLAELLGGTMALESELGRGSLFAVTLPRVYPQEGEAAAATASFEVEPGAVPVLLVAGDSDEAFAVERALAGSRYQPIVARSLAETRRALDSVRPAAIILDAGFLGDATWRYLIELKQREILCEPPVLILAAGGEEQKALMLGAEQCLGLPLEPARLLALLDQAGGGRESIRVLVVDDDAVSRYLVRQLLPRAAYDIAEAASGLEGLALLRAAPPDIVLLDLDMPGMDGFAFLDALGRADDTQPPVPAVILTSMILDGARRGRLGRASRIVAKSALSGSTLVDAITAALGEPVPFPAPVGPWAGP